MPREFDILDHPSDVGIRGRGPSRETALEAAALGVASLIADPVLVRGRVPREWRVEAREGDLPQVAWLNEIPFLFDAEAWLFADFKVEAWTEVAIVGHGLGEGYDPGIHVLRTAVKAVTYHGSSVREVDGGWELEVYLDI